MGARARRKISVSMVAVVAIDAVLFFFFIAHGGSQVHGAGLAKSPSGIVVVAGKKKTSRK